MLIASGANLIGPFIIKHAIDSEIPDKNITGLTLLSGIFLAALVISGICMKWRIRMMADIGQSIIQNIRKDLFSHLQSLSFSFMTAGRTGKFLSVLSITLIH